MISVIMCVKNAARYVKKSIESILNQSFVNFEFLILDDNSNDSTFEILKEFEAIDKRIKIFKNDKNLGLTKSLNILISHCNGEFIARQDADDISEITRFEIQIKTLIENEYEFCVSRARTLQEEKIIPNLSYYFPDKLVAKYKNPFIHGTLMIKKETLLNVGCYDEKFYYAQDYKLFKDLLRNNTRYKYINKCLYNLNTINNISSNKKLEQKYYFNLAKKNKTPLKFLK